MSDERDKEVKEIQHAIWGERGASDPKSRDGLGRRVEDLEGKMQELDPLTPYLKLFGAAVKYLGLPATGGLLYALWRYVSDMGGAP